MRFHEEMHDRFRRTCIGGSICRVRPLPRKAVIIINCRKRLQEVRKCISQIQITVCMPRRQTGFQQRSGLFRGFFFASAKQILCFSAGSAYCIGLVRRAMKQFFLKALPVCRVFGRKTAKHEKTMQKGGKNIYKQRKIRKEG